MFLDNDEGISSLVSDEEILEEYVRINAKAKSYAKESPSQKQKEFLALDCLEALYGGAAGGGKSSALLMAALQYAHVPGYSAIIFRRTTRDASLSNSILDRATSWLYNEDGIRWVERTKTFVFPTGSKLTFGYLESENDKYTYQGAEFQFIGFDELTQFSETQYRYLFSRLRRKTGFQVPLRMRAATNPGGRGHGWVHKRFIVEPGTRVFVPAKLNDNPGADAESYERSLAELDETTRAQLRDGKWITGDDILYKFDASRNTVKADAVPKDLHRIWSIDFGASELKPTEAKVVLGYSYSTRKVYVLEASRRKSKMVDEIAEEYKKDQVKYNSPFVKVIIDQGGLGSKFGKELVERHHIPAEHAEKQQKLGYRKLMNGALERGEVLLVEETCSDLIQEYNDLIWNKDGTDCAEGQPDHCSDAALYAWRAARGFLAKEQEPEPDPGSREAAAKEAEKIMEAELSRNLAENGNDWWENR